MIPDALELVPMRERRFTRCFLELRSDLDGLRLHAAEGMPSTSIIDELRP